MKEAQKSTFSVTQVLSPWSDFSMVRPDVLDYAADRGTRVHRLCAAHVLGLWIPKVDPDCAGYFEGFKGWAECIDHVHLAEDGLRNDALGYHGHPDLIVSLKGDPQPVLVEIKTPAQVAPTWPYQLAAYRALALHNGIDVMRYFSLRLKGDGSKPIVNEFTSRFVQDYPVFLAALKAVQVLGFPTNAQK